MFCLSNRRKQGEIAFIVQKCADGSINNLVCAIAINGYFSHTASYKNLIEGIFPS